MQPKYLRRKHIRADLHIHTDRSDRLIAPAEVVRRGRAAGLDVMAITDHDSMGGLHEAQLAADEVGVHLIAGVEMTACLGGHELHLLAYFPAAPALDDKQAGSLARFLAEVQAMRRERLRAGIKALRLRGVLLSEAEVLAGPCDSFTRLHLARALLHAGYVRKLDEAFNRFLGDKSASVPVLDIQPESVIEVVHRHGGLVVWAHPDTEVFANAIDRLVAAGLDGVETHNFRRVDTAGRFMHAVRERGLLATGGSDWHGGPQERELGAYAIGDELFEPFYEALSKQGAA
jgi:3',5'-nucleoside bisphosphate phosphatase